jgi:hypothetical protein
MAATLTMKQVKATFVSSEMWRSLGFPIRGYRGEVIDSLRREHCEQNFRHFMNVMNRKVFGKAAQRHGLKLRVIPVIEGGNDKRWHYHTIIDCPRPAEYFEFAQLIRRSWVRTDWGYNQIKIRFDADFGWIRYMMKSRDKQDGLADSIDWMNFYNP